MSTFLMELGSEEIPARFLAAEEKDLENAFKTALNEHGLQFDSLNAFSTPRRSALLIEGMSPVQTEKNELVMGPPKRIALTQDGEPTKAMLGFLKTNNAKQEEIIIIDTPKGEYLALNQKKGGESAKNVLAEICPAVISGLHFGKTMRWGNNTLHYARPLRWILALLDDEVVPFTLGSIDSGNLTYGHRVHGPGPFRVKDASLYLDLLNSSAGIVLKREDRRGKIIEEGNKLAAQAGGQVEWNAALLDEVSGLVEHPIPLLGSFDRTYLEIPPDVLVTSMETHQKSFGIKDREGRLLPFFLTVLNLNPQHLEKVKAGWERVLRARLEDARFFWRSDLQDNFEHWLEKLDHVIFIASLGSMGDKTKRLEKLCEWLSLEIPALTIDSCDAKRSGRLSKADLVTGMVGEFDTLQGIMGGIYAEKFGEKSEVAQALKEQYLPQGPDSELPASPLGAILSIADKADTLVGCFGLNMIPTGMSDPNGLRRCALGIIRICISFGITLDIRSFLSKTIEFYGKQEWKFDNTTILEKALEFFKVRLRNYFLNQGYDIIKIDAVIASGINNIPDCAKRLEALSAFSAKTDYKDAVQTYKRLDNIVKKNGSKFSLGDDWEDKLLTDPAEKELAKYVKQITPLLDEKLAKGDYKSALEILVNLKQPLSHFFEKVMVICDDRKICINRLTLLNSLARRFDKIAKFSALQI